MRHVIRSYSNVDKPDKLVLQSTIDKVQSMIDNQMFNFSENIYRASYSPNNIPGEGKKSKTIEKLNIYYKYKCAYCESIEALDVEHYRPKGRIDNINGVELYNPGYYWLAYEWSNLIPSCIKCNREGGKHNKFPYLNRGGFVNTVPLNNYNKIDVPKCLITNFDLVNEYPMLLHPEIDNDFLNYFKFKIDEHFIGIEIEGIDSDRRGFNTIEICDLNRESLRRSRYIDVIKPFIKSINSLFTKNSKQPMDKYEFKSRLYEQFDNLYENSIDNEMPYTLLCKYIINNTNNFEEIVLAYLPGENKEIVKVAFGQYFRRNST